jgi:hypothetical protein
VIVIAMIAIVIGRRCRTDYTTEAEPDVDAEADAARSFVAQSRAKEVIELSMQDFANPLATVMDEVTVVEPDRSGSDSTNELI